MSKSSSNEKPVDRGVLAVLSLGSNLGSREDALLGAVDNLRREPHVSVESLSSLYETEPLGEGYSASFINAVCVIRCGISPRDLLALCKRLEEEAGRAPENRDRPLDLDIIMFGDLVIREEGLEIPHCRFRERMFVLVPLDEVSPDIEVPPDGKTVLEIRDSLPAAGWVRIVSARGVS